MSYYVYILTNTRHTVFYTGITNNLIRRIYEHKNKLVPGFTSRYNLSNVKEAILREKQVKDYRREKKLLLINKLNPDLSDLYKQIAS